jgi:transposase-like protein
MEAGVKGRFGKLAAGKAEIWRSHLNNQRVSGQSVRAWCLANDVSEHSFYFWRRKLAGDGPGAVGLARVRIMEAARSEGLRLRLGGGRELILPASMPMAQVVELVAALERLG